MAEGHGPKIDLKEGKDRRKEIARNIEQLTKCQLLVGIPASTAPRPGSPMNNATIGYIHEYGTPAANIPERPWLRPGIAAAMPQAEKMFAQAARAALSGKHDQAMKALNAIGLMVVNVVRARISSNIPPPLAAATVQKRLMRTQEGRRRLKALMGSLHPGEVPQERLRLFGMENMTTLVDTSQLRSAISYVIRKK